MPGLTDFSRPGLVDFPGGTVGSGLEVGRGPIGGVMTPGWGGIFHPVDKGSKPGANTPAAPAPTVTVSTPTTTVTPAAVLNTVALPPSERQLQVAGVGNVLRILYGSPRIGADVALIRYSGDSWYILAVWGKGPIGGVAQLWVNDATPDATVTATHYTGTQTQMPDPTLQALLAAEGKVYADRLLGIAYSVVVVPSAATSGFPNLAAKVNGRALYDPRLDSTAGGTGSQRLADSTTWTYSDNPALALADFRAQLLGKTLAWSTVAATADTCDALLGVSPTQEKRRTIALALEQAQSPSQWTDTLRTYAGCMVVPDAGGEKLVPLKDATGTSEMSFDHSNIVGGSLKIKKRGIQQVPRYVEVQFTDTGSVPYISGYATAMAPGLSWATAAPSRVSLTGVTRYSQALREAIERLNQFLLNDLSITFTAHDERALRLQAGTLIDVTSSLYGWSAKLFRVDAAPALASGAGIARYQISAVEYDPAVYSDSVQAIPTTLDTTLGSPSSPPAVTGLTVTEEPYVEQYAVVATQARLAWNRPTWPFLQSYWLVATVDGAKAFELAILPSGSTTDSAVTPKLRPGSLYSFAVYCRSSVATGSATFVGLRPLGKSAPPSDVASINGFSVGGETFLSWTESTDNDQIHIRYEVRYGTTGGDWGTATPLQKIAAIHYSVPGVPTGTWRFYVKAIDSIGQYSAAAAYVDIAVSDVGPYAETDIILDWGTLNCMTRNDIASQSEPRWVSDNGDGMGYGHVDTNNATGVWVDANVLVGDTITEPWSGNHSSWVSDIYDHGSIITANWAAQLPYRLLSPGAAVEFALYLSTDGTTYIKHLSGVAVATAARYAKVSITDSAVTSTFSVDGRATLQIVEPGKTKIILNPNASGSGTNQRTTISQSATQSAALEIVLPAAAPTAGQVLTVDSVSGGKAITKWA